MTDDNDEVWGRKKREEQRRREWENHLFRLRALETEPEPVEGYGPSWNAIVAGRREFAGRVLSGAWVGHEALVVVYGELDGRPVRPEDFGYSVDYWMTDPAAAGEGEGDPDRSMDSLEEVYAWLTDAPIEWYPPLKAVARVGLMFGRSGREEDLDKA